MSVGLYFLVGCYSGVGDLTSWDEGVGEGNEEEASDGAGEGEASAGAGEGNGRDSAEGDAESGQEACDPWDAGPSRLRRLTRIEYDHTVRDLLGLTAEQSSAVASGLAADEKLGPFASNWSAPIGELGVEQFMDVAEQLAGQTAVAPLLACDPLVIGEDVCAHQFIDRFGRRAHRRALSDDERLHYQTLYATARDAWGFEPAIRLVIEGMLQSPYLLYHIESPPSDAPDGDGLDGWSLASRLSYFLWSSMPDDELFAAAEADELSTKDGLRAQAERMLASPRARDGIASFHLQWLSLDGIDTLEKDPSVYPVFNAELRQAMRNETVAFADYVIRQGDARLDTLLTAPFSLVEAPLLELYGLTTPANHDPMQPMDLNPEQRAGLLTQAGVLAVNAHANQGAPIRRGVMVRRNFLCQELPDPPPDVNNTPPQPDPNSTTRERIEETTKEARCQPCHVLINGLGFGLENYDGIGQFRVVENGKPIDASGSIVGSDDVDGPFEGAVELAHRLAQSEQVQQCVARQWFRFALGRPEAAADDCSMQVAMDAFADSGEHLQELLISVVTSEVFRLRKPAE